MNAKNLSEFYKNYYHALTQCKEAKNVFILMFVSLDTFSFTMFQKILTTNGISSRSW